MKKSKFSFIDICIVLAVICIAAVGFYILKPGAGSESQLQKVTFTVLGTHQQAGVSDLIMEGDDVVISFSEDVHATVVEAYEEPTEGYYFNTFSGKYLTQNIDDESDVYVTLTCDASVSDTAITNDSLAIRVGDEMPVRGRGYVVKGYVVDVVTE